MDMKVKMPSCCLDMFRNDYNWVMRFKEEMTAVGNSVLNAGLSQEILALYNCDVGEVGGAEELPGGSMEKYMEIVATDLGLDYKKSLGLMTAAKMKNTAVYMTSFKALEVMAVVTAGIDVNGGRVGEPTSYYEENGDFFPVPGTVNIFLTINANLSHTALMKAIITATEAKTAAVQELMAGSVSSSGLATGSGTDGIIVAMNPKASLYLTDAGMHSKLGECIGTVVKKAVKEALFLETGLCPKRQLNALERLKRYKVDEEYCYKGFVERGLVTSGRRSVSKETYLEILKDIVTIPDLVALTASLLHLDDEIGWGLLPKEETTYLAENILKSALQNGIGGLGGEFSVKLKKDCSIVDLLVDFINTLVLAGAYKVCST